MRIGQLRANTWYGAPIQRHDIDKRGHASGAYPSCTTPRAPHRRHRKIDRS
jgi:hypothetical protein